MLPLASEILPRAASTSPLVSILFLPVPLIAEIWSGVRSASASLSSGAKGLSTQMLIQGRISVCTRTGPALTVASHWGTAASR